jgi:hypothetical protein
MESLYMAPGVAAAVADGVMAGVAASPPAVAAAIRHLPSTTLVSGLPGIYSAGLFLA